jgi:hypothetical protein
MNPQEFTIWLKGFLDAINRIEDHHIEIIRDTLKNVGEPLTKAPTFPRSNIYDGELVPYNTICGCNPINGGSGICGCVIGNKLVPRNSNSKSNIYTTTTDNIPFNWQYKEPTKQILHD